MAYWTRIHPYRRIHSYCHSYVEMAIDREALCDWLRNATRSPLATDRDINSLVAEVVAEKGANSELEFCTALMTLADASLLFAQSQKRDEWNATTLELYCSH